MYDNSDHVYQYFRRHQDPFDSFISICRKVCRGSGPTSVELDILRGTETAVVERGETWSDGHDGNHIEDAEDSHIPRYSMHKSEGLSSSALAYKKCPKKESWTVG